MHPACALSSKVNNNRANAKVITLRGFNDLGRSVTPSFSFDGSFSLPIFYVLRKNEENLSSRSFNF